MHLARFDAASCLQIESTPCHDAKVNHDYAQPNPPMNPWIPLLASRVASFCDWANQRDPDPAPYAPDMSYIEEPCLKVSLEWEKWFEEGPLSTVALHFEFPTSNLRWYVLGLVYVKPSSEAQ